jgi:hypothetical protein
MRATHESLLDRTNAGIGRWQPTPIGPGLKAAKWAGFVLSIAVLTWIMIAMYSATVIGGGVAEQAKLARNEISNLNFAIPVFSAMVAIHWLFAAFVNANVAYFGGIVLGYRRIASV